jgi:predicted DCC family thiol-disulfide oxidoreductase YuxK
MARRIAEPLPIDRPVVLYDGHCRFCKAQMKTLLRLARRGAIDTLSFQDAGVLERFPGLTHEECMEAMQLVVPDGRVYRGMEAAVRAVATRRWMWIFAWGYYVPGIRHLLEALYRWIANNRYRLMGREAPCEDDACSVHAPERR